MNTDLLSKRAMRTAGVTFVIIGILCFASIPLTIKYRVHLRYMSSNHVNAFLAGVVCVVGSLFFFRLASCENLQHDLVHQDPDNVSVILKRFHYVDASGEIGGPVTREELINMIKTGILTPSTQVRDRRGGALARWETAWIALGVTRRPKKWRS